MICLPNNEGFENRRVYVTKKSSVKPVDSTICLPATLQAFAKKRNLNLKVKIITKHSQLKMKSLSVGVNTKLAKRSGLQLFTKSKNLKKALFHSSTLSDRFKRDRNIILRCPWEKEIKHSKRENKQDFKMLSKNYGNILLSKFGDSIKKISRNDLRHKLNNKTIPSPKSNKDHEYKRILSKVIRPKYSETSGYISKTFFNDCVSQEELLTISDKGSACRNPFKGCEILLQQNHSNSNLLVNKPIVNESLKLHITGRPQNKRGILALNDNKSMKDVEITVKSPTKSNSHLRNDDVLELLYIKNTVIKSKNNTHISENQLDSSDSESSNQHPNRRLQGERMANNEAVVGLNSTRPTTIIKHHQDPPKVFKAAEMWEDILKSPDIWKVEDYSEDMELTNRKTIDYHGMLERFVFEDMELKTHLRKGGDTLNEKRFMEKLNKPDFRELLLKFYIPPAQDRVTQNDLSSE
uniref:Uncharacterized protein n=1 Tax=Homalodisca liturata TaxID=320908 RepID=A0A1B6INT1_9HEMI